MGCCEWGYKGPGAWGRKAGWSCPRDSFSFSLLTAFALSSSKSSLGASWLALLQTSSSCRHTPMPLVSSSLPPAPSRTFLHTWGHWGGKEGVMGQEEGLVPSGSGSASQGELATH